jgi:alanyl-tRNA synthetase
VEVVLDSTPFYAESGGQVGDHGLLVASAAGGQQAALLTVEEVSKAAAGRLFVHKAELQSGTLRVGHEVRAEVDAALRARIKSHHTATHLLQSALKRVVGADTCQQGSMVSGERLRFDFNLARPMTTAEVAEVGGWAACCSAPAGSVL